VYNLSVGRHIIQSTYRTTSIRSRPPYRRRAPHTGRGSDSLTPRAAGPRLQDYSRLSLFHVFASYANGRYA